MKQWLKLLLYLLQIAVGLYILAWCLRLLGFDVPTIRF